uniref:Uncharacterized protein n=1 Tax=Anguilla anguilla TaxID=7936 RepID=A0A0E9XU14_ANGAN
MEQTFSNDIRVLVSHEGAGLRVESVSCSLSSLSSLGSCSRPMSAAVAC